MSRLTRRGSFQFDNSQIEEKGIYVKVGNGEEIFFAEYEEAYPAIEKLCNMEDIEDQISTILDDKVEQEANAKLNELVGNSHFGKLSESENQKSCNTCTNKKTHDALTENGNVPMCCLHCKWAEDLIDKWKGEKI